VFQLERVRSASRCAGTSALSANRALEPYCFQWGNMTIRKSISILAVAALLGGCGSGQHTSDSSSASQDSAASQQADSNDTTGQGLSKADELSQVDTGATALKVYGNPDKWSGTYVKFPCKISNVVDAGDGGKEANATCGDL
jgi:uncharacterized protein YceK